MAAMAAMAASRACLRILSSPLLSMAAMAAPSDKSMAALSVEPLPVLMVEHLKVMAASRACLRILMVER